MGVPVYSSAVFNFIPKTAMEFYRAVAEIIHYLNSRGRLPRQRLAS